MERRVVADVARGHRGVTRLTGFLRLVSHWEVGPDFSARKVESWELPPERERSQHPLAAAHSLFVRFARWAGMWN